MDRLIRVIRWIKQGFMFVFHLDSKDTDEVLQPEYFFRMSEGTYTEFCFISLTCVSLTLFFVCFVSRTRESEKWSINWESTKMKTLDRSRRASSTAGGKRPAWKRPSVSRTSRPPLLLPPTVPNGRRWTTPPRSEKVLSLSSPRAPNRLQYRVAANVATLHRPVDLQPRWNGRNSTLHRLSTKDTSHPQSNGIFYFSTKNLFAYHY